MIRSFCHTLSLGLLVLAFLASPAAYATVIVPLQSNGATVASVVGDNCHGCTVEHAERAIVGNRKAYADISIPLNIGGRASISVGFPETVSGAQRAGFRIGSSRGLDVAVLEHMMITTYLDGAEQETGSGGSVLLIDLLRNGSADVFLRTKAPFDSVRFQIQGLIDVSRNVRVYNAYAFIPDERVEIKETPTVASGASVTSGLGGLLCLPLFSPCDVSDAENVVSEDTDAYASMSLPLGVAAKAWIDVHFADVQTTRPRAGFIFQDRGGLLDIDLLRALTITTYKDGVVQESKTGDSELYLNTPRGMDHQYVSFGSKKPFDQIRITTSGLLSHGVNVDVFHAYLGYSIRVPVSKVEPVVENKAGTPATESLSLEAPAPNPASRSSRLSLSAGVSQDVAVSVFDMTGREVAAPFSGYVQAGESLDVSVDASRLPSGSYIVQAIGAQTRVTQRLTVIR